MIIGSVNALCASGKTHALANRAINLVNDDRCCLIVQPTEDLIDETMREIAQISPGVIVVPISKRHCPPKTTVGNYTQSALINNPGQAYIVLTTHSNFVLNDHNHFLMKNFDLFLDEVIQIDGEECLGGTLTSSFITQHLSCEESQDRFSKLVVTDSNGLRRFTVREDKLLKNMKETAKRIRQSYVDAYCKADRFEKSVKGFDLELSGHSLITPSLVEGFNSVTILSAFLDKSMLYKVWSGRGVQFIEDESIKSFLRFSEHPNTNCIRILYAYENDWSKNLRDSDNRRPLELIVDAVNERWRGEKFLFSINEDMKKVPGLTDNPLATKLSGTPHGINGLSHHTKAVFLSALNHNPVHCEFLEEIGVSRDEQRDYMYYCPLYQAFMRTAVRDPNNTDLKEFIVADYSAALWLKDNAFKEASIENLELPSNHYSIKSNAGRPRVHLTDNDRKAASKRAIKDHRNRLFEKLSKLYEESTLDDSGNDDTRDSDGDEIYLKNKIYYPIMRFQGSIYRRVNHKKPWLELDGMRFQDLVSYLKGEWGKLCNCKQDVGLISPAKFDRNDEGGYEKDVKHVLYATYLVLDIDNGNVSHDHLAELLPSVHMVTWNTYSHSTIHPRYRVLIPLSDAVCAFTYKKLAKAVIAEIEGKLANLNSTNTSESPWILGADPTKVSAASYFYLPNQGLKPGESFFCEYKKGRSAISPYEFLDSQIEKAELSPIDHLPRRGYGKIDKIERQKAVDLWLSEGVLPRKGDTGLYELFIGLQRAGMWRSDAKSLCIELAAHAASPKDRIDQAKRL